MEALILEMGVGEDITDLRLQRVVEASTSSWMGFTVDFMMGNGLQLQHEIMVLPLYCQHYRYITKAFALNRATTDDLEAAIRCRLFLKVVCLSKNAQGQVTQLRRTHGWAVGVKLLRVQLAITANAIIEGLDYLAKTIVGICGIGNHTQNCVAPRAMGRKTLQDMADATERSEMIGISYGSYKDNMGTASWRLFDINMKDQQWTGQLLVRGQPSDHLVF
jgi:hypothetical protein